MSVSNLIFPGDVRLPVTYLAGKPRQGSSLGPICFIPSSLAPSISVIKYIILFLPHHGSGKMGPSNVNFLSFKVVFLLTMIMGVFGYC